MPFIKFALPYLPEEILYFVQKFQIQFNWITDPKSWIGIVLLMCVIYVATHYIRKNYPEFNMIGMVQEAQGDAIGILIGTLIIGPKLPVTLFIIKWSIHLFSSAQQQMAEQQKRKEQYAERRSIPRDNPSTIEEERKDQTRKLEPGEF